MSFFSSSDPNSSIVKEAQKSIDIQARAVDSLKKQLTMLTMKVKELTKIEAKEESATNEEDNQTET
jgi:hypothetical protein